MHTPEESHNIGVWEITHHVFLEIVDVNVALNLTGMRPDCPGGMSLS